MAKEILINVSEGEECRIAVVEDGKLEELYMERTSATSHVGNIYKGRVTNVEPSIQAAFVDFGLGRNGFLHISDLMPTYFGRAGDDIQESVGRKMARRDRPPIQRCLRRGDEIIVQIIKEGIGTKGPTLSTYLSIPGRILVMMPGMSKLGVSRKIEDDEERRRLRQILESLKPPRDAGFILRTAGVGKPKVDIQRDLTYLTRLWQNFQKMASEPAPQELYTEGDLVTRTVRDVLTSDIERIIVDNKDVARRVKEFIKIALPRTKNRVDLHEDPVPLFHMYGIEREIELMYSRHVPLPSGGSLVIDSTEAIVAIDVNSGKFRDHNDAEMTAYKTDLEAADEIPRQLRLRDLGGVIICDFIDLRFERHRRDLEKRLHENLRKDRAKTKMLRMSQFGIIEMTRQRMRPSLKRSIYADCPYCKGAGLVKTPESMALDVMRRLAIAISDNRVASIDLAVSSEVAFYLNNKKRAGLADLEIRWQKRILIRSDATLAGDAMSLQLFDSREGLVFIEELGMFPQPLPVAAGGPPRRGGRNDHRQDRRDRYDRGGQQEQRGRREEAPREAMEDRFDIDSVEDAVDRREEQMMDENTAAEPLSLPSSGSQGIEAPPADMDSDLEAPSAPIKEAPAAPTKPALRQPAPLAQPAPARPPVAQRQPASAGRGRSGRSRPGRGQAPRAADQPQSQPPAVARKPAPLPPPPLKLPAPSAPPVEEPVPALDDEQPAKRRRTRRGTRGRGGHSRKPTQPAAESAAAPAAVAAGSPAPSSASPVRTGSTDRHLMRDEPVLPQPIARPRTYRDLDHIPDDLD